MFSFPVLDQAHELKSAYDVIWEYSRFVAQVFDANLVAHYEAVQIREQLRLPIVPIAYETQVRERAFGRTDLLFYFAQKVTEVNEQLPVTLFHVLRQNENARQVEVHD